MNLTIHQADSLPVKNTGNGGKKLGAHILFGNYGYRHKGGNQAYRAIFT